MDMLTIDAGWAAGLLLSLSRVGAFVVASPIFSRAFPATGRLVLTVAAGLALMAPIGGDLGLGSLLGLGVMNVGVGLILGYVTGLIFYLFEIAGSTIDFTSSLSVASVFDPVAGRKFTVFSRGFSMTALAIFLVIGGDRLLIRGLATSVRAVPLDGSLTLAPGIADVTLRLVSRIMIAGIEVAIPAIAALFLAELLLGVAARFAPQANVFILGFPVKIMAALATVSFVVLAFPSTSSDVLRVVEETFRDVLGLMMGA